MNASSQDWKTSPTDHILLKDGNTLDIVFIRHASLMLHTQGTYCYVDPVSDYTDYTQWPKADIILITHEHSDHFDLKALQALIQPSTLILTNASSDKLIQTSILASFAAQKAMVDGISGASRMQTDQKPLIVGSHEMKPGDLISPKRHFSSIEACMAYNTTAGREKYHPKGRDIGFILSLGGLRIYIAGDTENIPEMSNIKQIDIAFLPVNQPYTMTLEQAVLACRMIRPGICYPYHFGNSKVDKLPGMLQDEGIEVRIRPMP